jgi:hypothetical protein
MTKARKKSPSKKSPSKKSLSKKALSKKALSKKSPSKTSSEQPQKSPATTEYVPAPEPTEKGLTLMVEIPDDWPADRKAKAERKLRKYCIKKGIALRAVD